MKILRKVIFSILIITGIIALNGVYYVFWGHEISKNKLYRGQDLNLYEICSIYTVHTALWMLWWPASPAAANEVFTMQFNREKGRVITHRSKFILNSLLTPKVVKTMKSLKPGEFRKLAYNGNVAYSLFHPEHKAAMAINPCKVSREVIDGEDSYVIRLDNTWPLRSCTEFHITKNFMFTFEEGLFRYLQDKGIINNYTDEYVYPVSDIQATDKWKTAN